jgi:hypothetical protein
MENKVVVLGFPANDFCGRNLARMKILLNSAKRIMA